MKEKTEIEIQNLCSNIKNLRNKMNYSKKVMARKLKIGTRSLTILELGIIPKRLSCCFLLLLFDAYNESGIKIEKISDLFFKINV